MSFHVDVVELAEFSGILALVSLIPDIRHATIAKDARGDFFKELGHLHGEIQGEGIEIG